MASTGEDKGNQFLGFVFLVGLFFAYRWWTTPSWYVMDMSDGAPLMNLCMPETMIQSWERSPEKLLEHQREKGDDVAEGRVLNQIDVVKDRTTGQSWAFIPKNDAGKGACEEAAEENGGSQQAP